MRECLHARGLALRFTDLLPVDPELLPVLLILNLEALGAPGERNGPFAELVRQRMAGPLAAVPTLVLDPRDPKDEDIIGWAAGVDAYLRPEKVLELLPGMVERLLADSR
ncbi:MAG: hypothetical protein ACK47B_11430 [Armatimonadota bacterium]